MHVLLYKVINISFKKKLLVIKFILRATQYSGVIGKYYAVYDTYIHTVSISGFIDFHQEFYSVTSFLNLTNNTVSSLESFCYNNLVFMVENTLRLVNYYFHLLLCVRFTMAWLWFTYILPSLFCVQ